LDAVKDANAIIIRSDIIDAEVLDAAKELKIVSINHHTQSQFGNSIRVLSRSIHHTNVVSSSGSQQRLQ